MAIIVLRATPFQVGILAALEFLPFPVLGLVAGVWADRLRRRPLLIVCDIGRTIAFGSIPLGFAFGFLGMPQLYAVALVGGIFNVFFAIAYQSYLPALIDRADLIEGNSKLEVTRSLAQVGGPAVAGYLIQALGAATAVLADAASYVVSVLSLLLIRRPEPAPTNPEGTTPNFRRELAEGAKVVLTNPLLRRLAGCTGTSNLGSNVVFAVFLIFLYRNLGFSPGTVGLVFAVGSVGGLLGALSAQAVARRLGLGPTLLVSIALASLPMLAAPLAAGVFAVPMLMLIFFLIAVAIPVYNVNQVSLRQAITPDRLQGRMNATMRTISWGTIPVGSVLGGWLGSTLGVVPTLYIGAAIGTLATAWVALGPVIRLRTQPVPAPA